MMRAVSGSALLGEVVGPVLARFLGSITILIMPANPIRALAVLVAALGHQVEILIIDVHHVDAARISRIGMEYDASRLLCPWPYNEISCQTVTKLVNSGSL